MVTDTEHISLTPSCFILTLQIRTNYVENKFYSVTKITEVAEGVKTVSMEFELQPLP